MSANEVLEYIGDLMEAENLRPTQAIDTLLQAIEDNLEEPGDEDDPEDEVDPEEDDNPEDGDEPE